MPRTRTYAALLTALAAVVASWDLPASAAPSAGPAATSAREAAPGAVALAKIRRRAIITFAKNWADPSDSRLTWRVVHQSRDGVWHVVEQLSWRAGSGMLGTVGVDECAKGRGWLPDGRYRLRFYRDYHGNLIKGRAFRLDDHRCRNGRTWRVQLFIHTEQDAGNAQCADLPGDQPCRWEVPEVNDYTSAGCIKLAPTDIADLSRHFLQFYRPGVRYSKSRVVVRVRG